MKPRPNINNPVEAAFWAVYYRAAENSGKSPEKAADFADRALWTARDEGTLPSYRKEVD